ncbi:hypothetical protein L2D01_05750 [Hyphomonadaceae bacterium ML37]|nr:hypothetical protein L2D01_05750 [Hyphomonadaceae bacterium ML37]
MSGMNGIDQRVNPYAKLELILSLREVSEVHFKNRSFDPSKMRITIYDYLFVDIELGMQGAQWDSAKIYLGIDNESEILAKTIGSRLLYYFDGADKKSIGKLVLEASQDIDVSECCDKLWKRLVACT